MTPWPWLALDRAGKRKPVVVEAVTYLDAKECAARHFGFVVRHPNGDEPEISKVEVRVLFEQDGFHHE